MYYFSREISLNLLTKWDQNVPNNFFVSPTIEKILAGYVLVGQSERPTLRMKTLM